jgi:hypothetical protein
MPERYEIDYEPSADHVFVVPLPRSTSAGRDRVADDGTIVSRSADGEAIRFEFLSTRTDVYRRSTYLPDAVKKMIAWLGGQRQDLIDRKTVTIRITVEVEPTA